MFVRGWVGVTDMGYLLKLRLVVARLGEIDLLAGGIQTGSSVRWERQSFAVGSLGPIASPRPARCSLSPPSGARELYKPPNAVTLWDLPAALEDDFDQAWATWIDHTVDWEPFFAELEHCTSRPRHELTRLELVSPDHLRPAQPPETFR